MPDNIHRGRIQAQGNGVEKSENWSQDNPLTSKDALILLENLKSRLSEREFEERKYGLKKAKALIQNASENGGIDAVRKLSYLTPKTKETRINIEVLGGTAFIKNN